MRSRSSVTWAARIGVTPRTSGWSVNALTADPTVTAKVCAALRPPGSVAVTRIVAAPSDTGVTVTRLPNTAATCGADVVAP